MPSVLVTGFEPFGGSNHNPSAQIAQALHGHRLGGGARGAKVHAVVLPCVFSSAMQALDDAIDRLDPALIVCIGLAAGRHELSFERVAINLVDARIADNQGHQPVDERVRPTSRDAYFTNLPVKAMMQAAQAWGAYASLSLSAGSYVCNAVFFALMHRIARDARRGRRRRGGFVHVPCTPEQVEADMPGCPSMPLATMVEGLRAAIERGWSTEQDLREAGGTLA